MVDETGWNTSCESCKKKGSTAKKGLVVQPIISTEMNSRCQIDLIDMQAQSDDNGREFANQVVTEICAMWPELKIVHGKPRHSQSQGSVERANQDIENILATWLQDNRTKKWRIKCSPYEAMFGTKAKIGLKSTLLPINIISNLRTQEDLEKALNSISTVSNSNNDIENKEAVPLRIKAIRENRTESLKNLKVQAIKMMQASENRFCQFVEVGQSVTVKIPDVDRARSDFRNIIGVILLGT
ncbi:KRAB-A domain-containing protein 2-like [Aphis gossypii]|uniref:KRAB-A domain-containing protein 2-like n=1 Tax=Aphis gossypii TaxID=80765 RepID=UPI0021591342|nr:KRAB-A domain-containing protein 2-like [Aphis gossypii]